MRGVSRGQKIMLPTTKMHKQKSSIKRKFSKHLSKSEISSCQNQKQKQIVHSSFVAADPFSMCLKTKINQLENNYPTRQKSKPYHNIHDQPKKILSNDSKIDSKTNRQLLKENLIHVQKQGNISILGQNLLPSFRVLSTYLAKFSLFGLKLARNNLRTIDKRIIRHGRK